MHRPALPFPASLTPVTAPTIDAAPASDSLTDRERLHRAIEHAHDLMEQKRALELDFRQQRLLYESAVKRLDQVIRSEQRPVAMVEDQDGWIMALCANGSAWRLGYSVPEGATKATRNWAPLPPIPGSPAAIVAEKTEAANA